MFETFIIQPIFNLILFIYSVIPGNDFGVAIILFTIITRFAMWPLIKKQLHQTRVMRELQPQIKEIKKKAKGDRTLESQLMMELYKEKGVNPLSSLGLLFVQLPIFIGLFSALKSLESPARLIHLPYSFIRSMQPVQDILADVTSKTNFAVVQLQSGQASSELADKIAQTGLNISEPITTAQLEALSSENLNLLYNDILVNTPVPGVKELLVNGPFFDQHLFGIDLSRSAIESGMPIYVPLLIIAVLAGVMQYLQTKQISAGKKEKKQNKTIRQILKESSDGKEPDQAEINAVVGSRMTLFFAPMIAYISAISLGGLAVYFLASGTMGYLQQRLVLNRDVEEMEDIADEPEATDDPKADKKPKDKTKKAATKKTKKSPNKNKGKQRNKKKR
jgi:YidC/Oxa1 family membrane protein insertase